MWSCRASSYLWPVNCCVSGHTWPTLHACMPLRTTVHMVRYSCVWMLFITEKVGAELKIIVPTVLCSFIYTRFHADCEVGELLSYAGRHAAWVLSSWWCEVQASHTEIEGPAQHGLFIVYKLFHRHFY